MRHQLFTAAALLLGCNVSMAQVSTMGTTAMGLPTTPGAIVTSPLSGPGPFSAATVPGTPDTTLAPVPLASDPATPGTVVTCATPTGQIKQGIPAVPATISTSLAVTPATPFGAIATPIVASATGTLSPASPSGSASITVCSPTPGGPPANGAALPLSTPQIPGSPPPGTIQPAVAELAGTSIDPNLTIVPTPNSAACSQSVTTSLANPTMMAPANATGATATPGVPPPSGC
jgi:hypothetical protein